MVLEVVFLERFESFIGAVGVEAVLVPFAVAVATFALLMAVRSLLFRFLDRWGGPATAPGVVGVIRDTFRKPTVFWALATGIYMGVASSELPARSVHYLTTAIYVLIVLSITLAASNLSGRVFIHYVHSRELNIPTTGLAQGVLRGTIFILGLLVVLAMMGVSITPLLTALGVGGLAVALALQDTLANLFAGIHILVERSIRVGDFIKLESGQEGYVEDITWRTTRIRMLPNNMVVIPNSKLSQSQVVNYYMPDKVMSLYIPVGVAYSSDPERVAEILHEEAVKAMDDFPEMSRDYDPIVRFTPGFGDSALEFTLIVRISEVLEQFPVQSGLRFRIFKRFRQEGIEIPFPHRTVYFREEKGWNTKKDTKARTTPAAPEPGTTATD